MHFLLTDDAQCSAWFLFISQLAISAHIIYFSRLPLVVEAFGSRERLVVNTGLQASSAAATAEMEVS